MKKRGRPVHGWVVLDKPYGMSSTQAVGRVRWLFGAAKAGHGGTLDPLATGLLPIALGEATKLVPFAMEGRKIYRFTVEWGAERSTDDLEGDVTQQSSLRPTGADILAIVPDFQGEILQLPPAYSALKIDGLRAYDLARAGVHVALAPRPVMIEALRLISADETHAVFEVTCGKGTYVRALARDMGRKLGCFGFVRDLRRLKVGSFHETQMISLEKLEEFSHKEGGDHAIMALLASLETVLDGIPALAVNEQEAQRLRFGQRVRLSGMSVPIDCDAGLVTCQGKPVGIFSVTQGLLTPKRLFNL